MARAADAVVLENRAAEATGITGITPSVNSLSLLDDVVDGAGVYPQPLTPTPVVAAVAAAGAASAGARPTHKRSGGLCPVHTKWGKEAYRCSKPASCRMHNVIRPRPPQSAASPAPGNGKAGSRQ